MDEAKKKFTLKTHDDHFVTAVNGGGIGGPDNSRSPIHTDKTVFGRSEVFHIVLEPDTLRATIRTPDGAHYLSAVHGGGLGGSNHVPIHTSATQMGPEAIFQLKTGLSHEDQVPPAAVYGGPAMRTPKSQ